MNRFLPVLALVCACGPRYDGIDIELSSTPPIPVRMSSTEIEIPVGIAVAIDVLPLSSNSYDYYQDDQLSLTSRDRNVLRVETTAKARRFVVVGTSPGQTCVDIKVDYRERGCIPATVVAVSQ